MTEFNIMPYFTNFIVQNIVKLITPENNIPPKSYHCTFVLKVHRLNSTRCYRVPLLVKQRDEVTHVDLHQQALVEKHSHLSFS